eukprot:TRINITY_DN4817_c0_g1_i1.p1 TRINITY_DN4817_c0_g1~~TRINITY_DN4817_c0_g1_i1.p1  ORF type:complete len:218 (+),score=45.37 TRINITY_DN4817_c0_g1_i1:107-760(+)
MLLRTGINDRFLPNIQKKPVAFKKLREWSAKLAKLDDIAKLAPAIAGCSHVDLAAEVTSLISAIKSQPYFSDLAIVYGHNDLTAGNILLGDDGLVHFIDFEYSGYNYSAFDLGNHFCEHAGLKTQWEHYPRKQRQKQFLRAYLTEFLGEPPTSTQLENAYRSANHFALVSHLLWGMWAIFYAQCNTDPKPDSSEDDFNYVEYGKSRFEQFFKHRKKM